MKLGFLTDYSPERVAFARETGFNCLELQATPGSALDSQDWTQVKSVLDDKGISVSALACYFNHLEEGREEERAAHFAGLLEAAPRLGCHVVATMGGCTAASKKSGDIEDSLDSFTKVFKRHAKVAEDNGVKIAFENWPGGHPAPLMINIAVSPAAWDKMFDAVPSSAMGLEYDPSHLVRLNIEPIAPIKRFAERIHHVHAKDTTIKTDVLNEVGYIGRGWWHYSIPSLGVVDWGAMFSALKEIGYDGGVCIEQEDPNYVGDQFDEGLRIGQKFLAQYVK